MRIEGLDKARAALAAAKELGSGGIILALRDEVDDLALALQGAAQKAAPVDEGTLRGSATSETVLRGDEIEATVRFGGMASRYAEIQHENTEFRHPKGGQAHYLYGAGSPWEKRQRSWMRRLDRRCAQVAEDAMAEASR